MYAEGVEIVPAQGNTLGKSTITRSYPERVEYVLSTGSFISPLQGDASLIGSFTQGVTLGWNYFNAFGVRVEFFAQSR